MYGTLALTHRALDDLQDAAGDAAIAELRALARPIEGLRVLNLSVTGFGTGTAELLNSSVPLMKDLGLDLRLGYAYDPTPIPRKTLDVTLPDINRHVVTGGLSYKLPQNAHVDFGLLYVLPGERKTATENAYEPPLKGTYSVQALVASLSFGVEFGGAKEESASPAAP